MLRTIKSRPALVTAAAAVALLSMLVTGAAAAAAGHTARPGSRNRPLASSKFADWPMFRANPAHAGVSGETEISTTNATSLAQGWTRTLGTISYTSPAVATSASLHEALVYAGGNGDFQAYRASNGMPVWHFSTGKGGGGINTSPAVFGGVVYFGSTAGTVYALNASTGALVCSFKTGQLIQASPVVVNDPDGSGPVVYLGTDPPHSTGAEYAIYGAGNKHGACAQDWKFSSWQVNPGGTWSSPAYGTDATGRPLLVFGSVDPDDSVYALNAGNGHLAWRHATASGPNNDVGSAPTISAPGHNGFAGGVVYATGKNKVLHAMNLTTGKSIWRFDLTKTGNASLSSTALDGNTLYLGSNDGVYAVNATTGKQVWHVLTGPTFYSSPAIAGPAGRQVLVIGDNAGRLYALKLSNGSTVWTERPQKTGFWASPAVSQRTIFVAGLDGVLRSYTTGS